MSEATPNVESVKPAAPRRSVNLALIVALAALGVTGWQYYETRQALSEAKLALAQRLTDAGGATREIRRETEQALAATRAAEGKLSVLEARVNESAGQFATLGGMYQELTKNRTDWLLSELEHTLAIASQQLQLAGNVPVAISALEMVEARLARFDRPQLIALKKAVSKDLVTLKALPYLDTVGLTVKLDRLTLGVDQLPLVIDHQRLTPAQSVRLGKLPEGASWWERGLAELSASVGELVNIRRMDKPEALLLSPEQVFFLRENLKMRLLDARLALIQRDGTTFNADVDAARSYVERYFDRDAPATRQWLAIVHELSTAQFTVALPDLSASLKAVRDAQGNPEE